MKKYDTLRVIRIEENKNKVHALNVGTAIAKGGTEVWLTNFNKVLSYPFQHIGRTFMFLDQTLSILWFFVSWLFMFVFILMLTYFLIEGNYERVYHMLTMNFLFICFEMTAGVMQLIGK